MQCSPAGLLFAFTFTLAVGVGCGGDDDDPHDEASWEPAFVPSGWLLSVWGPSGDTLYAVGGAPERGAIAHRDASGWSAIELEANVPLLNWVHGFSEEELFVVGDAGTVLRIDGQGFSRMSVPTDEDLWGVWGAAPNDVWAVGGSGFEGSTATILHFDGTRWSSVEPPPLSRDNVRAFFKVWGTSADNVYVVGQAGVVLRYDGIEWREEAVGVNEDLISIWGSGPDSIVAVGGRGNGIVAHWDGTSWTTRSLSPLPGLNGVWTRSAEVAHVVGIEGTIAKVRLADLSYEEDYQPTRLAYHAIFGDPAGRLTAVGGNFAATAGPYQGIASTRRLTDRE